MRINDESDGYVIRLRFDAPAGVDIPGFFATALEPAGWVVVESGSTIDTLEIEGHGFFGEIEFDGGSGFTVQLVD